MTFKISPTVSFYSEELPLCVCVCVFSLEMLDNRRHGRQQNPIMPVYHPNRFLCIPEIGNFHWIWVNSVCISDEP